jgi:hypothetical protein
MIMVDDGAATDQEGHESSGQDAKKTGCDRASLAGKIPRDSEKFGQCAPAMRAEDLALVRAGGQSSDSGLKSRGDLREP